MEFCNWVSLLYYYLHITRWLCLPQDPSSSSSYQISSSSYQLVTRLSFPLFFNRNLQASSSPCTIYWGEKTEATQNSTRDLANLDPSVLFQLGLKMGLDPKCWQSISLHGCCMSHQVLPAVCLSTQPLKLSRARLFFKLLLYLGSLSWDILLRFWQYETFCS